VQGAVSVLGKASRAVWKVVAFILGRDSATRRGIGNPFALCFDFLLIAFDDGTDCALDRHGEEHVFCCCDHIGRRLELCSGRVCGIGYDSPGVVCAARHLKMLQTWLGAEGPRGITGVKLFSAWHEKAEGYMEERPAP